MIDATHAEINYFVSMQGNVKEFLVVFVVMDICQLFSR